MWTASVVAVDAGGQSDTAAAAAATSTKASDQDARERPTQPHLFIRTLQLRWSEFYSLFHKAGGKPSLFRIVAPGLTPS